MIIPITTGHIILIIEMLPIQRMSGPKSIMIKETESIRYTKDNGRITDPKVSEKCTPVLDTTFMGYFKMDNTIEESILLNFINIPVIFQTVNSTIVTLNLLKMTSATKVDLKMVDLRAMVCLI